MQARNDEGLDTIVIGASNASKFFNAFWKNNSTFQFIYLPNLYEFDVDPVIDKLKRINVKFRVILFLNTNRLLSSFKFVQSNKLHVHRTGKRWVSAKDDNRITRILLNYKKLLVATNKIDYFIFVPHFYRSFKLVCNCDSAFQVSIWKQSSIFKRIETNIKEICIDYQIKFVFIEHEWIFKSRKFWETYPLTSDLIHFSSAGLCMVGKIVLFISDGTTSPIEFGTYAT